MLGTEARDWITRLLEYIAIPSVTGQEASYAARVARDLRSLGFDVAEQEVSAGRSNLLATAGEPPKLVFCTHLDTVPPHIPPRREDGVIWGRGACDTKGVLIAQMAALAELRRRGRRDVALLAVVGEETTHDGAKKAASWAPLAKSWVILGEPTGNVPASSQKGLLRFRLSARGVAAHSGYPELGRSAFLPLMQALQALDAHPWPENALFGATTLNIGCVRAGVAGNVIPAGAEAELVLRASEPTAGLAAAIEAHLSPEVAVEWLSSAEPQAFYVPAGFPSKPVAFNTDAGYLRPSVERITLAGPGHIEVAHSDHERILEEDVISGIEMYLRMAAHQA